MAVSKHKIGDLVRVRDDADKIDSGNRYVLGQLGIVTELHPEEEGLYLVARMLGDGEEWWFCDEELEEPVNDET